MNKSSLELLTPDNCTLLLIDHQPQMFFGVESANRETICNNVVGLAKAAKIFNVPTILTTVAANTFSGPLIPQLQAVFPEQKPIDRTSMNSWEDKNLIAAVEKTKRKKLVIAALWTEVCLAFPALSALQAGYEVYAVSDASGATTLEAHNMAMQRMIQAGVVPMTWLQFMCELQRDWARVETYEAVIHLAKEHAGAYGIGIFYAKSMLPDSHGG
ncbi:hydrolase [Legionella septentrionalis]|uniref:Hydrolase n=1 Tax=Legionella septentrionalis TaxID=2498109 RepID=A0A3S0V9H8_9GAMM|nr:hydrolase [Legionella septentrionalis]RUQ81505.1 hydrolase [Legionella septentrionalis]RUQ94604.1 hydrolase [Legionella septentrionalis]